VAGVKKEKGFALLYSNLVKLKEWADDCFYNTIVYHLLW